MSLNTAHEGYAYQDLLTIYFILDELLKGNKDSIFSIDKKHIDNDRFDDLVITSGTYIQRKQIKYSNETTAKELAKDDFSNDSNYKLAIYELYNSWQQLNSDKSEFRLCLAWDEPTEDNIKKVLAPLSDGKSSFSNFTTKLFKIDLDVLWEENPEKFNRWDSLKRYVRENSVERDDFKKFCDELIIEIELPKASLNISNPSDLENILLKQAERLGIGVYPNEDIYIVDFLERFAKKIGEYRASSSEKSLEDILIDLRVKTDFGNIKQKFEIDQTKNIKSLDKFSSFYTKVIENNKTLLIGEPGSGKSWFLTNFIEHLSDTSKKVIRHYCFTSTEDESFYEKRVTSDVFFGNLIADIIKEFPNLKEVKDKLFASDLNELNILLSHIDEELIIIIDGLDHIDRVLKNSVTLSQEKTKIIDFISQINISKNISIILGSQPVNEIRTLVESFSYIEEKIPKWNIDDTIELMDKYLLEDGLIDTKSLSEYIFEKSEGNPLYLTYIIKTLLVQGSSLEAIEALPQYEFNLKSYYEYLSEQINNNITSEVLACLEFSVTRTELSEIITFTHHLEDNLKILSPVIAENISRGGIKLYHDSFRRFNVEKLKANANIDEIYKVIAKWLKEQDFYEHAKSYRHLLKYYIKLKKFKKVKTYASVDFLTKSLYNGYSEDIIKINYDNFLYIAKETLDWSLFVYLSEINRTIYTTISEDYNSEFLENFELYFEAVGLIYGFNRAYEMLFFDGEQNFSYSITAKAFYILDNYDYPIDWNLIENFFDGSIELEKFKYYICYIISLNNIDDFIKENKDNIFTPNYSEFLNILIEEIYFKLGIEKINEVANLYSIDPNLINKVLIEINVNDRLLSPNSEIELDDLNLDFIQNHYQEGIVENFFSTINKYGIHDIGRLKSFKETIPYYNFFYNWIHFEIDICIIENELVNNVDNETLSNEVLEKLKFLASDVEPFKGTPRACDLTRNQSFLMKKSIERALSYVRIPAVWKEIIECLEIISFGTMTYIKGSQGGVLPYGMLMDILFNYLNDDNKEYVLELYRKIDEGRSENYNYHLDYKLKKSILLSNIGEINDAKKELYDAVTLITSYTFHKDRTLEEIIEPLNSINNIEHKFAKKYAKKLKYLTDAVMKHTDDGKNTCWLTTEWFEEFLKVDSKLSSMYLLNQLLNRPNFWKLDFMFVDYIKYNTNKIDHIILNFLHKLSPTNCKNSYINSFVDNIYNIIQTDEKLAKQSLINILSRDLNNFYDKLTEKTSKKIEVLKNILNISIHIKEIENRNDFLSYSKDSLSETINKQFSIDTFSSTEKTTDNIIEYYENKDDLSDKDLNYLFHFLKENNESSTIKKVLISLIHKRLPRGETYFENIRKLINKLDIQNNTKIFLLVNIFIYSKDGWYRQFINKEALKDAIAIDENEILNVLAKCLFKIFSNFGYGAKSTANLIIAFEYAGINKEEVLSMYKTGFEQVEYRLPNESEFKWKEVKDKELKNMNDNEFAIAMILTKMTYLDSLVQKEIIFAINYIFNYNKDLLIKPIKWYLHNLKYFPHISIASLLELFLIQIEDDLSFFQNFKDDIIELQNFENLYIKNILEELLKRIENV
ncbi:hypothetical protein [Arcobacter roscoffensis]|uniref:Nephrocystin 3-like N-terminal domain-containing protein n=1 Tax=Arcobacter roscoffensis TaxID=2961520 RepID=A0ABY5E4Z2_9BACT|nr:hypothetical protein [Arcobacter roscoffensis]UTJ06208.1 hypothetical protein NJU99_13280 [Arcobacter roscoffensis]